ncbi:RHS repeat-associated protein [Algoriphagus chordae]|uniref:RHS repeat-associated protein n=2 Tax=Algoriphagus chordae TaxID=237019 RepID=A0A2W7R7H8_9BACT|nr:RHS repeat-associated protein [Algoriphagus chordae]
MELGVFGKYVDPKKIRLSPASFVRSGMDKKMIQQLTEYGQNLSAAGVNEIAIANVIALVITELQQKPVPEAYMGYALYNSDSTLYEQGKVILSKKARNKHEELIKKIAVPKDGYIETYLVNETSDDVWFDQFRILSTGPLIVQETHYDPWGVELSGLGYQYGGIKVNPYLYNGKEANGHLGVNLYDFGARLYDPSIGRWFVMDPMAEKMRSHSPYNYAFNNPLRYIDPDGMIPQVANVQATPQHSDSEDPTQNEVGTGQVGQDREDFLWSDGYGESSARNSTISSSSFYGSYQTKGGNVQNNTTGDPTIFVSKWITPTGFNNEDYYKTLKSTLVQNGFNSKLKIKDESIMGRLKAWWQGSPTATITIKNFNLSRDSFGAGGYARLGDPHSITEYNELSMQPKGRVLDTWKYVNASVHELGHGLFKFDHNSQGYTEDPNSIMDYRSAYVQGAGFNLSQQSIIRKSIWGN